MPSLDDPVPLPSNGWGPSLPSNGWEPWFQTAPTGSGTEPLIFSKIDTYGAVGNADRIWARTPQNRTYRFWKLARFGTSPMIFGCLWTNNLVEFYLSVVDCVEGETFHGMTILIKTGDEGRALVVGSVRQSISNRIRFQRSSVLDGECE